MASSAAAQNGGLGWPPAHDEAADGSTVGWPTTTDLRLVSDKVSRETSPDAAAESSTVSRETFAQQPDDVQSPPTPSVGPRPEEQQRPVVAELAEDPHPSGDIVGAVSRETATSSVEGQGDSKDTTGLEGASIPVADASVSSVPAAVAPEPVVSRETSVAPVEDPTSTPTPRQGEPWPTPGATRIITVANQKGGVGKTTSTVNLAAALSLHGLRVLVIDLDPQGNASTAFGLDHREGTPSVYDVLVDGRPIAEVAQAVEGFPNLRCVPATIDAAGAEVELVPVVARETRLRKALASVAGEFDYVFIDCPPSLGLLTVNALVAGQEVLIPIQCEFYALEGLTQLLRNIELVRSALNEGLAVSTILLTMYDARTRLADQVARDVRDHFGELVVDVVIPRSVRISEAPGFGQTVITYDPGSRGAQAYTAAARVIAYRGVSAPVPSS